MIFSDYINRLHIRSALNESTGGDCYQANGRAVLFDKKHRRDTLYHAEVQGQGRNSDKTFGHAFVLRGDPQNGTVFDYSNGNSFEIPAIIYFSIGNVEWIGNYFTYSQDDISRKVEQYGHWGPWDLKTKY